MDGTTVDERLTDTLWDLYVNWRRLKGYPAPATHPIEMAVDEAVGLGDEEIMAEFGDWLTNDCLPRLPVRCACGEVHQ